MTQPTDDQLAAAAQKARADHETAREIAARLLAPPDPVDILAGVIADHGEVADERDELRAERDALTADMTAIRGIVGRHGSLIAEAVRQIRDELIRERDLARADRDAVRVARKDATEEVERLSALLATAEADAETQRTAADDLRNALDRVATAAGFGPDGAAPDIADRVIDAIRRLSRDRDQVRVARKDAAEDLERLNAILSSAGVDITGTAAEVADRVAAALRRPALPADLRAYLEARRDRLVDVSGLSAASEIAALTGWIASPTAEVTK